MIARFCWGLSIVFSLGIGFGADATSFIKDGDRVAFFGDSITAHGVYTKLVERVFRHCHPEAKVSFTNNGQAGRMLGATKFEKVIKGDPTVVTIMIGMNDAIIGKWRRGIPIGPAADAYRTQLTALVRRLKDQKRSVVLMSPTLTEYTASHTTFRLAGTRRLLRAFGAVCREVAAAERTVFIPVQEEFEAYEESLPSAAVLRPDGVHPIARGQYRIAQSLWEHLALSAPLGEARGSVAKHMPAEVELSLKERNRPVGATAFAFTLAGKTGSRVDLRWSLGEVRGSSNVKLDGPTAWNLTLPKEGLPEANGSSGRLVVEARSEGRTKLFIVDLFRKAVLHGKDGTAAGEVKDGKGKVVSTYRFSRRKKAIIFEAELLKTKFFHSEGSLWPWGRGDALTVFLDLRSEDRLGALGYDGDVFQLWFKPRTEPFFDPGFIPWSGRAVANLASPWGGRTEKGIKLGISLSGSLNLKERVSYGRCSLIGADLTVIRAAALGQQSWIGIQKTDRHNFMYPGSFMLVDLDNTWKGDSVLTASVYPDRLPR
ncbi:MAG: GDSL-type esterase/lipase family protein [Planctomycetota bacterium]|jgi:lysophospholipase L1-like esterase